VDRSRELAPRALPAAVRGLTATPFTNNNPPYGVAMAKKLRLKRKDMSEPGPYGKKPIQIRKLSSTEARKISMCVN
jgi:hypothetical protein